MGIAIFKALIFLVLLILVGTKKFFFLIKRIVSWNSREFFAVYHSIGTGGGYGTYLFGLSFAFGVFLAGMVIGELDYGHQALSDITPHP